MENNQAGNCALCNGTGTMVARYPHDGAPVDVDCWCTDDPDFLQEIIRQSDSGFEAQVQDALGRRETYAVIPLTDNVYYDAVQQIRTLAAYVEDGDYYTIEAMDKFYHDVYDVLRWLP